MADRALVFKIQRLHAPALAVPLTAQFDLEVDTALDAAAPGARPPPLTDTSPAPYAHRTQSDAAHPAGGVSGMLLAPQAFGQVYIGQVVTVVVVVSNASARTVHHIGLRVELHGDRSKAVLFDTLAAPALPTLRPGEQHEVVVSHDMKEMGQHTLACAAAYAAADGERAYASHPFRFVADNPMVVRTKHRLVGEAVFLEATLENRTAETMLLDLVRFAPSPPYASERIEAAPAAAADPDAGPLASYIASVPLLPPGGGAASYVFRLERRDAVGRDPGGAPEADASGGAALGKLEIRWRGPMGEPARLQTQLITVPPTSLGDLHLSLTSIPSLLRVEQPFAAQAVIRSSSDRVLGPLKLSYSQEGRASQAAGVVMEGPQSIVLEEVAPRGRAVVTLRLLPLQAGAQLVQGLMLTDERDGRVFDTLKPVEVFVLGPAAGGQ